MGELRASEVQQDTGLSSVYGTSATGYGVDLAAEVERLRMNVQVLASVVKELRDKYNDHRHNNGGNSPLTDYQALLVFTPV